MIECKSIALASLEDNFILVWPTCWTPAVGGLFVCECVSESVCPKTCRHIARRMMNG